MSQATARAPEPDLTPGLIAWPEPINDTGMYGLAGEFVRLVEPHTEADRNILLLAFQTYAGNLLGRNFYLRAGPEKHCGNIFLCIVGHTGIGRKGSAMAAVETFFTEGTYAPGLPNAIYGVSSGEGIIKQIRDPEHKKIFSKKTQAFEDTVLDEGIEEKRLIVILGEMHQFFTNLRRTDSILSSIIRQGWDRDRLQTPSKNSGLKATGAHLSLIGGISPEELLEQVTAVDAQNGTLNRMLFASSRRSKELPQNDQFEEEVLRSNKWTELQKQLMENMNVATQPLRITRDTEAMEDWGINGTQRGLYHELTKPRTGTWGDLTNRAAQQVMRLSLITATINGYHEIRREHQDAGEEQWRYCDQSTKLVFSIKQLEDRTANEIISALTNAGRSGMTRTQIRDLWNRNKSSEEITQALKAIAKLGIAEHKTDSTGGRPVETWFINKWL